MKPRGLIVDDDPAVRVTLGALLEEAGLEVTAAGDAETALTVLSDQPVDIVMADLCLPGIDGIELVRRTRQRPTPPKVIVITGFGSDRRAVEAMRAGAYDYFHKPLDVDQLLAVVRRATESVTLSAENSRLATELLVGRHLVFASDAMRRAATLAHRVAARDTNVLIRGESGTGKERIAEAIVALSPRANRRFVRFNCAGVTRELAAAELFGHSKGAFTGAHKDRGGLLREADGGTILLDEIGEMDPQTQAQLLRVLEDREVRPVGEDRGIKIDVRVLAATNRDLEHMVQTGQFREDLYYRLRVVELVLPPLRERPEDVEVLAGYYLRHFIEKFGIHELQIPKELVSRLCHYHWPGNVRELRNTIESLVALSWNGTIDMSHLAELGFRSAVPGLPPLNTHASLKQRMDGYERGVVLEALQTVNGNRSAAAKLLGVSRATLHSKLRKHNIVSDAEDVPDDEENGIEAEHAET